MSNPLILTAAFPAPDQARFDRLREAHFPAERNHIPAHLTLFHHLPGDDEPLLRHVLATACTGHPPCRAEMTGLRSLGRGVAFQVSCPPLATLRATLAKLWHEALSAQDRQGWRPHITVQNKVTPEEAKSLLARMQEEFAPFAVPVEGLHLWRYDGGPWHHLVTVPFAADIPNQ